MTDYFTGDLHIGHKSMVEKGWRDYASTTAMDIAIVEIWNKTVNPEDTVYLLGDVGMCPKRYLQSILLQLNGNIRLIRGNHDKGVKGYLAECFEWVKDMYMYRGEQFSAHLCHYPMLTWDRAHRGVLHFHGHCHNNLFNGVETNTRFDVGWDKYKRPMSAEEMFEISQFRQYQAVDHHVLAEGETGNAGRD